MATTRKRTTKQTIAFEPAGLDRNTAEKLVGILQGRLASTIDLALTLKHVHWNVVGPHFIGVHEMIDPQVEAVQAIVDATAERIGLLGGSPNGLAGQVVKERGWDDYALGRDLVDAHLAALDLVYTGVIASHRDAIDATEELDPVTQDMLIDHTAVLEQFHWFVRAHLERADGHLIDANDATEKSAAGTARRRATAKR